MISLADVSKYGLYTIKWILCDYISMGFYLPTMGNLYRERM